MMSTAPHGAFVHLYINGMYWGVYNPVERPDASFAASYLGGDKEDWDAVNAGAPVSGSSMQPWYDLMNFNFDNGSTAAYQRVQGNFPNGTDDPGDREPAGRAELHRLHAAELLRLQRRLARPQLVRGPAARRGEHGVQVLPLGHGNGDGAAWIRDPAGDMTGVGGADCNDPAEPYYWLRMNADFQMLFADRAHKHLFNGGALTTAAAVARYESAGRRSGRRR